MGEIGRPVSSRPVLANGYEQRCDRREHSLAQFVYAPHGRELEGENPLRKNHRLWG
jgi:hypothetical protein